MSSFSRIIAVVIWGLLVLVGLWQASALRPDPTLRTLIPADDEGLTRQDRFFAEHAASRLLYLEAAGDDVDAVLAELREAARHLEALGATAVAPPGQRGFTERLADHDAEAMRANIRLDDAIYRHLPVLVPPRVLAELGQRMEHEALVERLREARRFLLRPGNELWAGRVYRDVLGLEEAVRATIGSGYVDRPHSLTRDGILRHDDDHHFVLVCAVGFPPDQRTRTLELMDGVQRLRRDAREQGVALTAVGAYPHYADHFDRLETDLAVAIPASILLIFGLLWTLYRKKRDILAAHMPALAAVIAGIAAAVTVFGPQLPLAVLVFAGVILGVAVDYGIHMTRAVRDGRAPQVRRPLIVGFATTAAAFLTLLISSVPAVQVLALTVSAGLVAAILTALMVLPRVLRRRQQRDPWQFVAAPLVACSHRLRGWGLLIALVVTAAMLPGLLRLELEGSVGELGGSRRSTLAAEAAFLERWGDTGGDAFLIADSGDLPQAIAALIAGRDELDLPLGFPELLLPPADEQTLRLAAWTSTWQSLLPEFEARLEAACREVGLRARAFAPSLRSYRRSECPAVDLAVWQPTTVGPHLERLIVSEPTATRVISPIVGDPGDRLVARGETDLPTGAAWLASRELLAAQLEASIFEELLWRGLLLVGAVVAVLSLTLRNPVTVAAVAVPPLLALVWTFAIFGYLGVEAHAPHLLVAAFVIGIGIDDAIFLSRSELRSHVMSPILATTATTAAGIGALVLAGHPSLNDLGFGIVIGMACCLLACLLVTPSFDLPRRRTVRTLRSPPAEAGLARPTPRPES